MKKIIIVLAFVAAVALVAINPSIVKSLTEYVPPIVLPF